MYWLSECILCPWAHGVIPMFACAGRAKASLGEGEQGACPPPEAWFPAGAAPPHPIPQPKPRFAPGIYHFLCFLSAYYTRFSRITRNKARVESFYTLIVQAASLNLANNDLVALPRGVWKGLDGLQGLILTGNRLSPGAIPWHELKAARWDAG